MGAFADRVRSGEWTGATGKRIRTIVNIGIGGSDLGPVMVYRALRHYADAGISVRFVSNIDPVDLVGQLDDLDPETTLFIVASKTFSTSRPSPTRQRQSVGCSPVWAAKTSRP